MEKARFEDLEKQVASVKKLVLDLIDHNIRSFKTTDQNFELINEKLDEVAKAANVQFGKVDGKLDGIQIEIEKIQKVSNYSDEYENLLRVTK